MKKDSSVYMEASFYTPSASKSIHGFRNIQLPSSISAKLAEKERNETKSKKVPKIRINNFGY